MATQARKSNQRHSIPTGQSMQGQAVYQEALLSSWFNGKQDPDKQILLVSTGAIGFLAVIEIPAICAAGNSPASPFINSLMAHAPFFSHGWFVHLWLMAGGCFLLTISTGLGKFANNGRWMDLLVDDLFGQSSSGADQEAKKLVRRMRLASRIIKVLFFLGVMLTVAFVAAKQAYC